MKTVQPNFIVGIGGSAGGLNAYKALLDALPSNTGMAFVIISHITPSAHSQLAEILSRHTKMLVTVATTAMLILANNVYVIPPGADLLIEDDTFKVISPRTRSNVAVDIFLTSLAKAMGKNAIGVILSGFDGDGADGCMKIKANGGVNFAQDKSAEVGGMPLSAQATGCVDFVLSPEKIAEHLVTIALNYEKLRG